MSKATSAKSDRTRQRILDAAAAAFRRYGVDRVGVREVMKLAGLTRGGFYFHFADKDSLLAEATRQAALGNAAAHLKWAEEAPEKGKLRTFIEHYLSEEHRDQPELGCVLAALGSEIGRASASQRKAFTESVDVVVEQISALMPGVTSDERRQRACLLIASMAGVLTTSRALSDRASSNALLAKARQFYIATFTEA